MEASEDLFQALAGALGFCFLIFYNQKSKKGKNKRMNFREKLGFFDFFC